MYVSMMHGSSILDSLLLLYGDTCACDVIISDTGNKRLAFKFLAFDRVETDGDTLTSSPKTFCDFFSIHFSGYLSHIVNCI